VKDWAAIVLYLVTAIVTFGVVATVLK